MVETANIFVFVFVLVTFYEMSLTVDRGNKKRLVLYKCMLSCCPRHEEALEQEIVHFTHSKHRVWLQGVTSLER